MTEPVFDANGWATIDSAPRDGTHILARLFRDKTHDMDERWHRAFAEVREIYYKPYTQFGMFLPWHAGDPIDSHEGLAPDHMGEAVPTHWKPLGPGPVGT